MHLKPLARTVFLMFFMFLFMKAHADAKERLTLQPHTVSPFTEVVLEPHPEGDRLIVRGSKKANDVTASYQVHIDRTAGTYTVEPQEASHTEPPHIHAPYHTGWVSATTRDLIGINLARSTLNFSWYDHGTTISHKDSSLHTWAAHPTPLGTHWYVREHQKRAPYAYEENTKLRVNAYASYYNYDFLNKYKITESDHFIQVDMKNDGTYDYVVNWTRRGESWFTLILTITVH
ncbi:hypothetical protein NSQ26_08840 [Bacillus sp. FSL W7-1360]